jgi:hypothetical protein
LVISFLACSAGPLYLAYPNEPFESLVLVLEEREAPAWVLAVSGEAERAVSPEVDIESEAGLAIEALLLPQSLAELSIPPGLVTSDSDGYCLPFESARVFRNVIEPEFVSGWAEVAGPSPLSRSFRRAATPEPCTFDVTGSLQVVSGAPIQILVGHADPERLVAGGPDGLFVLNRAGEVLSQDLNSWCAGEKIRDSERLILARCTGEIFDLDLDAAPPRLSELFRLAATDNGSGGLIAISAQAAVSGLEVFMLSQDGLFLRRSGAQVVERLHDYQRPPNSANYLGGLAVLGPGHAVVGLEVSAELFEYRGGLTRFIDFGSDSGISTIHHSEWGLMIGTTTGALWHRAPTDDEFRLLEDSPNGSWLVAIETLPSGDYLYALTFGSVGLYEFGRGFCGPEILSAQSHRRLTRFGTGFAVSGQNSGVTRIPITLFEVQKSGRSLTRDCGP